MHVQVRARANVHARVRAHANMINHFRRKAVTQNLQLGFPQRSNDSEFAELFYSEPEMLRSIFEITL